MKVRKEDKDNFDEVGKARWSEAKRRRSGRTTGKKKYMKGRTEGRTEEQRGEERKSSGVKQKEVQENIAGKGGVYEGKKEGGK
jgi:hypothetical protein